MDNQIVYSAEDPQVPPRRGRRACFNCRRRKIRCDLGRPICGQCARDASAFGDCEYADDGRTNAEILEEQISALQARIDQIELERRSQSAPTRITVQNSAALGPLLTQFYIQQTAGNSIEQAAAESMPTDLPLIVLQALVHNFIHAAGCFGFFLNTQEFHDAVTSPTASPTIPSAGGALPIPPVLLNVLYLWGVHLSRDSHLTVYEAALLAHALKSTANALPGPGSPPPSPRARLYALQASVLLAYYFIRNARLLEGRYHTSVAVSIALCGGLNNGDLDSEQRDAFWAVVRLDKFWSTLGTQGGPSLRLVGEAAIPVEISWPGSNSRTEQEIIPRFLNDVECREDEGSSIPSLRVKASILFDLAVRAGGQASPSLRTKILSFIEILKVVPRQVPVDDRCFDACTVAQGAVLKLNTRIFNRESRRVAQQMGQRLVGLNLASLGPLDPVLAPIWAFACLVLINAIREPNTSAQDRAAFTLALDKLTQTMEFFAPQFELMRVQLRTVQSAGST